MNDDPTGRDYGNTDGYATLPPPSSQSRPVSSMLSKEQVQILPPGCFESAEHYYPRVLNAQIHPLARFFLTLGNERIAVRYCHLHPEANLDDVRAALSAVPRYFRWGGADLFHTTDEHGLRRMMVIETNSCPSGQKSLPFTSDDDEEGGYRRLLQKSFLPILRRRQLPKGRLAVLWDKNAMEVSGYASALADLTEEPVLVVPCFENAPEQFVRTSEQGVLEVLLEGEWEPIRAAFRYVTQRPWARIPPLTRTAVYNPVLVCLAGGRNKMLAAKAYDLQNAALARSGLSLRTPETIWDVSPAEIPWWVHRMGGVAVVKNPYSNAGQGVWTITSQDELDAFMEKDYPYERLIVQGLIGNAGWSSRTRDGKLYHVGTMPTKRGHIYAADLRVMVGVSPEGFFPVAMYARRARTPLTAEIEDGTSSWSMLGTNLSVRNPDGTWGTESERLLLLDRRDFNSLGFGLDDFIEAYVQTILAVTAVDTMAIKLVNSKGRFRRRFFASVNPDPVLLEEIIRYRSVAKKGLPLTP